MKYTGKKGDDLTASREVIRIKEEDKPYWHKIVDGPERVHTIFYPTIGEDGKTRKMSVTVADPFKNLFSPLAEVEKKLKKVTIYDRLGNTQQAQEDAKKVRSEFSANSDFYCLILDKHDEVPVVKMAAYRYSVYKKLVDLEASKAVNDRGDKDESKLRYGLLFMWWAEITRTSKGQSSNKQFDTEYSVRPLEKFIGSWESRTPAFLLGHPQEIDEASKSVIIHTPTKSYPIKVVDMGIMSLDEFMALVNYPNQLHDLVIPMTNEEILDKLTNYPLQLDATDDKGNFLLPDWQKIKEEISSMNLELPIYVSDTPKKLSAPKKDEPLFDEEPEQEPPKKRGRPAKESKEESVFEDKKEPELVETEEVEKDDDPFKEFGLV